MGGGKGKRHGAARPKLTYKVVQQSYEDKDYEDAPKPVLVPTAMLERKRRKPMMQLESEMDLPEDFSQKRNMKMENDMSDDDRDDDLIFGDEVEAEFDQEFIRQMMTGEGVEGFDPNAVQEEVEEDEEDEEDETGLRAQSKHDTAEYGANERMFARMLREFNNDEDLEESDPRVQGPLGIEAYAEALKQFAEDNAGTTWIEEGAPKRHKGFINKLQTLSMQQNVFDSNAKGLFFAVAADKGARLARDFKEAHRELIELTKAQLAAGAIDTEDVLYKPDEEITREDGTQEVTLKPSREERMDCETILSTYSTLYNHPNIIAAEKGKLKLKRPRHASKEELVKDEPAKETKGAAKEKEEEEEEDRIDFEAVRLQLSMPPKDETPEEKKARKALFKKLQAERRQDKKMVKSVYAEVGTAEASSRKMSKAARATTQLSLVSAVARR